MGKIYRYFVEGGCEKKFIEAFNRSNKRFLEQGKVEIFNVVNDIFTPLRAMDIKKGSYVVLIYDSDVINTSILEKNIATIKKYGYVKDDHLIHLISVNNFEEEIVYSTSIKNINELLKTKSVDEFKSKFIANKNIVACLTNHKFNPELMWSRKPQKPFDKYYKNKSKGI